MRRPVILLFCALVLSVAGCGGDTTFITIGTGGATGVYFPIGGHLATLLNDTLGTTGVNATAPETSGSVYNITMVMAGQLELGIAQSDRQYQAFHGLAEWKGKPQTRLRAICCLHPEVVTLVATVASGISSPADLNGKRVNLGDPGSGNLGNALDVLTAFGLDAEKDLKAEHAKAADAPGMLLDGNLDAFFYTLGHPGSSIMEATAGPRPVRLVPIAGPGVDALLIERPYYAKVSIDHTLYEKAANEADIPSYGFKATLICSADLPDDLAYRITRTIFEHLDQLRGKHPCLAGLEAMSMLDGLSAPIHQGALRYFQEAGLR